MRTMRGELYNRTQSAACWLKWSLRVGILLIAAWLKIVSAPELLAQQSQAAVPITAEITAEINAANELVRQGAFKEAEDAYQRLRDKVTGSELDILNYNLAVALYRGGELAKAEELFASTGLTADKQLAARSRYNQGNCQYATALQLATESPQVAIEELRSAIESYRSSLRLDRDNPNARANIELAVNLLRQLEQQQPEEQQQKEQPKEQQQEKQEQDQPQQRSQQQAQQQQAQDQESPQQQDSQQANQQQQQDSQQPAQQDSQPNGSEGDSPKEREQQPDQQAQSESAGEETDGEQSPPSQPAGETPDEPTGEETNAGGDVATAGEEPEQEQTTAPDGQLSAVDQDKDAQQASTTTAETLAKGKPMTREEALKMLQAVRDRDMLRRLRQERRERSRHIEVDKDW